LGGLSNKWRGTRARWTFLALLVSFIPLARADAPQSAGYPTDPAALKKLSLEELSQIEVTTPSKEPEKAFDTAAAIFVITGEDIRRSGATNIPDALRLAPGMEVARIDANHWSVGIRGFGTRLNRSVLVLMDGRTVYTSLFDGTYWEVQDTLLEDVDRIEVIRGPGGTVWGPNAVNGVIDIITKSAQNTHGTFVSAGGGETDTQGFLNVRYGGGNGKGFDYRLYGKTFTSGPEDHSDNRNFDDWRSVQGGFRMDWTDTPHGTFTVQGDIYDEEAGESVQVDNYTQPYSQNVDSNALLSGGNIMGRWQRTFSDSNDIQVQAYYDRTYRDESNIKDIRNTIDIDFLQRLKLPAHQKVTWGLGARVVPVKDINVVSGLTFVPDSRTDYLLTGFLQDEIALLNGVGGNDKRLTLTLGTKLLQTNFLHGIGLEPSARLAWTLDEKQTVWAAFTHALRTPSDVEENFYLSGFQLNFNGIPVFARFNANTRFAPEQMNGYELGYRRLFGKHFLVDTASFYNHYHDLFDQEAFLSQIFLESSEPGVSTPAPVHYLLPAQFGNGLLAYTKGIEVSPEWRPAAFWRLRGSYSYLHMTVYNAPGSVNGEPTATITGSSPAHQVTVQSLLDISKKLQLDLTFRYVSALPFQSVPAYSTADARIAWQLNPHVEFSLVGTNLLQPSHFENAGDTDVLGNPLLVGIERSGYAQIAWRR
jgi:iron complex outermembrane recepter protein